MPCQWPSKLHIITEQSLAKGGFLVSQVEWCGQLLRTWKRVALGLGI